MVRALAAGRLQTHIRRHDSSMDRVAHQGSTVTPLVQGILTFTTTTYGFALGMAEDGGAYFEDEWLGKPAVAHHVHGSRETEILRVSASPDHAAALDLHQEITCWEIYHLNDTGIHSPVKKECQLIPGQSLAEDFSNLASWLYFLRQQNAPTYELICSTIQLVCPDFETFHLEPTETSDGTNYVRLFWKQRQTEQIFSPAQLSDGTLRFMCLCAALNQPKPPTLLAIDEPELGIHPQAMALLAELLEMASHQTQIIVATQAPGLVDQFRLEDTILIERGRRYGDSHFTHPRPEDYSAWLEDNSESLGDLWARNVIHGKACL